MKMSVGKKIMGGFLAVIIVVAMMSGYTYLRIGQINADYQTVMRANVEKILLVEELATDVAEEAGTVRRFNLTGDPAAKQEFQKLRAQSDQKIVMMEKLFVTEQAQKLIKEIRQEKGAYEAFAEKAMQAKQSNNQVLLLAYIQQGEQPYDATAKGTQDLVAMIKDFIKDEQVKIESQVNSSQRMLLIINLLVILAAIAVSLVVSRGISKVAQQLVIVADEIASGQVTKDAVTVSSSDEMGQLAASFNTMKANLRDLIVQVARSAEHVSSSSQQLTASANQSAEAANQISDSINSITLGAENQMASVEETSAVVEQMTAGVQQVAASANQVSSLSSETALAAKSGGEASENAIKQMIQIEQTVNNSAAVVGSLGERSKEIGQIVDTISGLAGQTNLLALNAAIEAARAGEQGRGFAVVAEEVRKLAEQSQEAAKQIADLIQEIQRDTDKAVLAMNDGTREVKRGSEVVNAAGAAFQKIEDMVDKVAAEVREISAAMQQMASGSDQVVRSVRKIDELSKQTVGGAQTVSAATEEQSASVEEIAASSQSLASMAEELQTTVRRFRL